jgi:hypothetical protein
MENAMKYLFLMYGTENCWTPEERKACMVECLKISDELAAQGKFIATSPLQSVTTAATVRMREGRLLITDGPYAETTEQLGGFFLSELADLDEAIAVAARLPPTWKGTAEIRPVFAVDGLPPERPVPAYVGDANVGAYMLICYDDEATWRAAGPTVQAEGLAEAVALTRQLSEDGKYLSAAPLHPAATATCVRLRDGKRVITDGPFAETHEVLAGFYLILADSRDEALAVAAKHPGLRHGAVEVRPLFDFSALRKESAIS